MPIARHHVLEQLPDAVLVLSTAGVLLDANAAGRALLDRLAPARDDRLPVLPLLVGPVDRSLRPGPRTLLLEGRSTEVDLDVTELYDDSHRLAGHVVTARNLGPLRRRHAELTAAHRALLIELEAAERRRADLAELAVRDSLTGVHNRRELTRALRLLCSDSAQPFAVLLVDLDHFKRVNDTHGHDVGDQLLVEVASVLVQATRAGDTVVRYGGEEFLVLMHWVDSATAVARAEELRVICSQVGVPVGDHAVSVSVSCGVASSELTGRQPAQLQRAADDALYRAKREGRNRVVLHQGWVQPLVSDH